MNSVSMKICFPQSRFAAAWWQRRGITTFQPITAADADIPRKLDFDGVARRHEGGKVPLLDRLASLAQYARAGGGEKAVHRHTVKNKKMLVRDRIRMLCEATSVEGDSEPDFFEIGVLAGLGMYRTGDVQCAGVVTGIGKVAGRDVMIIANDATVSGGASFPITVKKTLRAQEIAIENSLPCVYIVDSAGAFLPLQAKSFQTEIMEELFYNQARLSAGGISQIAIVPGSCSRGSPHVQCVMKLSS